MDCPYCTMIHMTNGLLLWSRHCSTWRDKKTRSSYRVHESWEYHHSREMSRKIEVTRQSDMSRNIWLRNRHRVRFAFVTNVPKEAASFFVRITDYLIDRLWDRNKVVIIFTAVCLIQWDYRCTRLSILLINTKTVNWKALRKLDNDHCVNLE